MHSFETILEKHPLDPYALQMAFLLAVTTGAPQFSKLIPPFKRSHLKDAGHANVSFEALQALNPVLRERSRET